MVDRSAARNQYCWIASITPRKYNKAFQSLPVPLPHVTSRTRQSCPRRDNGRSRGHPVGRLEGTRWLGPDNPPSPSFRSTTSFSLFSFSPCLLFSLSVCLTIPHHGASRADLPGTRRVDSVSFSPSRRTLGSLSHGAVARIVRSPRTSVAILRTPLGGCVWSRPFFSQPACSVRPDNVDDGRSPSTTVVRPTTFRATYSRSRPSELTPISQTRTRDNCGWLRSTYEIFAARHELRERVRSWFRSVAGLIICPRVSSKARVETSTTDTEDVTLRGPPRLPRPSPCRGGDDPPGDFAVSVACAYFLPLCRIYQRRTTWKSERRVTPGHWRVSLTSQ